MNLTRKELKQLIHYNPLTGTFTRLTKASTNPSEEDSVGCLDRYGYRIIKLSGKRWKAHRLAYFYMTGKLPEVVDHINNIRDDNRWKNLRGCSLRENKHNCLISKNNSTGVKGISFDKARQKYLARVYADGKPHFLGYYDCIKKAERAVKAKRKELHGRFANHG